VTSFDELKLRTVVAIETVVLQVLENTWRETDHILRAKKGAHVEAV
jgi:hypothetical protein